MLKPTISVVISTHNRMRLLAALLDTLGRQTARWEAFETIVVDNNSSDETARCVGDFCREHSNAHYVFEGLVGLSHARNAGWRRAAGTYVAFVDDDCLLPDHWMETALRVVDEVAPSVFGGPIRPFFEHPQPVWFKDEYCLHEPYDEPTVLEPKAFGQIHGGNALIRRDRLEAIGGFDPSLGMAGNTIGFGEDTKAVRQAGNGADGPVYFHPSLYLFHLVRAEKTRWLYNIRKSFVGGRSRFTLDLASPVHVVRPRSRLLLIRDLADSLGRLILDLPRGLLLRNRRIHPYLRQYAYEHTLGYIIKLGFLYEQFRAPADLGDLDGKRKVTARS